MTEGSIREKLQQSQTNGSIEGEGDHKVTVAMVRKATEYEAYVKDDSERSGSLADRGLTCYKEKARHHLAFDSTFPLGSVPSSSCLTLGSIH